MIVVGDKCFLLALQALARATCTMEEALAKQGQTLEAMRDAADAEAATGELRAAVGEPAAADQSADAEHAAVVRMLNSAGRSSWSSADAQPKSVRGQQKVSRRCGPPHERR